MPVSGNIWSVQGVGLGSFAHMHIHIHIHIHVHIHIHIHLHHFGSIYIARASHTGFAGHCW